jgi:hypothetical protein
LGEYQSQLRDSGATKDARRFPSGIFFFIDTEKRRGGAAALFCCMATIKLCSKVNLKKSDAVVLVGGFFCDGTLD